MNPLDLILAASLVSALFAGYRIGLVARVASWVGGAAGFVVTLRLLPSLLRRFGELAPIGRLFVTLAILAIGAAVGSTIGGIIGSTLRRAVPGPLRLLDRVGGAVAGIAGTLVGLWLLLPVVANVPGDAARLARGSTILGALEQSTPQPPDAVEAIRSLMDDDRFPKVFDELRRAPDTGSPPGQVPVDAAVVARAVASTVNVESEGCGGLHEGSGFAVATDTVVTNAHVVAGADGVRVRRPDGRLLRARIVAFDDDRDLALLAVEGLGLASLEIATTAPGSPGAVLGYPGGQNEVRVAPAVVSQIDVAVGRDIYGNDRTRRQVLFLAASLQPGDSGSALIDTQGRVVGVAFAIAPDRPNTSYALADSELRAVLAAPRSAGAGGPCV